MSELSKIAHETCVLATMIEGLDALHHAGDGSQDCPLAKRARNGLPSMIEATIAKAWAVNDMVERAELASHQK